MQCEIEFYRAGKLDSVWSVPDEATVEDVVKMCRNQRELFGVDDMKFRRVDEKEVEELKRGGFRPCH